jgi:hypothetical protein
MSIQATKRLIERKSEEAYYAVLNVAFDSDEIDNDTAVLAASAAQKAVEGTLRRLLDCEGLTECFAQAGK